MPKVKSFPRPKRSETKPSIKKIENDVEHLQFTLNIVDNAMDNMKIIIKEIETNLLEYSKNMDDEFSEDSSYNKKDDNISLSETSDTENNAMETTPTTSRRRINSFK